MSQNDPILSHSATTSTTTPSSSSAVSADFFEGAEKTLHIWFLFETEEGKNVLKEAVARKRSASPTVSKQKTNKQKNC